MSLTEILVYYIIYKYTVWTEILRIDIHRIFIMDASSKVRFSFIPKKMFTFLCVYVGLYIVYIKLIKIIKRILFHIQKLFVDLNEVNLIA